LCLSLDRI